MPEYSIELFPVEDSETISRFLTDAKKHFNKQRGRVLQSAFKPRKPKPEDRKQRYTLSTYRIKGLSKADVWHIAKKYVTDVMEAPIEVIGRADVSAYIYKNNGLRVVPEPNPHTRHADIEGWEGLSQEVDDRLALRQELANSATLTLKD